MNGIILVLLLIHPGSLLMFIVIIAVVLHMIMNMFGPRPRNP